MSSSCTIERCSRWLSPVERHGEVLGPRAVTVGRGQNVIPDGLEIVPVGVWQRSLQPVHGRRRCGLLHGGLQAEGLAHAQFLRVVGGFARKTLPRHLPRRGFPRQRGGPSSIPAHLLQMRKLVLVPRDRFDFVLVGGRHSVNIHHGHVNRGRRDSSSSMIYRVHYTGRHGCRDIVSRYPGTCIDKQVATYRAGVCDLSLTD